LCVGYAGAFLFEIKETNEMIIDITGTELTPGNNFKDCLGNGEKCDFLKEYFKKIDKYLDF